MTHPVISDVMRSIVSRVSDSIGYTVHFQHGHMREVVDIVRQLSVAQDNSLRFPLIALKHDIKQSYKPFEGVEFDATMYIVALSLPQYTAGQRIDNIFKPYLYPIKEEFISQIARSGYFQEQTAEEVEAKITWYDRLFWGNSLVMGNDGNVFDDWVDAIELDISGLILMEGCYNSTPTAPILLSMVSDTTGRFIFAKFSKDMEDPDGVELSNINLSIGESEFGVDSAFQGGTDCMYIFDLGSELITAGATVTITIPADLFTSADGVSFAGCTQYTVVNNVQL